MVDKLVADLLAAIEETETDARAAVTRGYYGGDLAVWQFGEHAESVTDEASGYVAVGPWDCPIDDRYGRHIARHDPASVLRRCAADRKIVALHRFDHECPEAEGDGKHPILVGYFDGNCPTMISLAKGYGLEVEEP